MEIKRLTRRFAAWTACFAILLASLAPSISHALAAAGKTSALWTEICSTTSTKLVKTANAQLPASPAPLDHGMHFEHCPFCFTHAGSLGLPPAADFLLPAIDGSPVQPSLFYRSPRSLFAWIAAQPRAPPFAA